MPNPFTSCDLPGCTETHLLKICKDCNCVAFCSEYHLRLSWSSGSHNAVACSILQASHESRRSVEVLRPYESTLSSSLPTTDHVTEFDNLVEENVILMDLKIRSTDGNAYFTGLLRIQKEGHEDEIRKLHDPKDIDGEYHNASHMEILTEMSHYSSHEDNQEVLSMVHAGLLFERTDKEVPTGQYMPISQADYDLCSVSGNGLIDFSRKPKGYNLRMLSFQNAFKYPFPRFLYPEGGKVRIARPMKLKVRAQDVVWVMASGSACQGEGVNECSCEGPFCLARFTERFSVRVASITSYGMITGTSMKEPMKAISKLANRTKNHLIAFPITCVISVLQTRKAEGGYW